MVAPPSSLKRDDKPPPERLPRCLHADTIGPAAPSLRPWSDDMPHALNRRLRAACLVADVLAFLVSTVRPLATWTEQGDEGDDAGRCVYVQPLMGGTPGTNASPWRLDLWREDSCIHARAFGCSIEVHYVSTAAATRS